MGKQETQSYIHTEEFPNSADKPHLETEKDPEIDFLENVATVIRLGAFETIKNANDGHLGSCSSSVELMTALYFGGILNYDATNPNHPDRDRVLVRGHVGPLRYKIFSILGWIDEDELSTYRKFGSRLQGHESMHEMPGVDITPSGSLGMVLSYGTGAATVAKARGKDFKTFVFLGDGEEQEGNVNEAARYAANNKLDNLIAIIDKNLAQLGVRNEKVDGATDLHAVWRGYGWDVIDISDGNNIKEVMEKLRVARMNVSGKPTLVIANTEKGHQIPGAKEDYCGYHTLHTCPPEYLESAINTQTTRLQELNIRPEDVIEKTRQQAIDNTRLDEAIYELPYSKRIEIPLPSAHNDHLVHALTNYTKELATIYTDDPTLQMYALTADLIKEPQIPNHGFIEPVIFLNVGIREQHMFAMAHGISVTDPNARILIKARDAFLYRAADQLNAIAQGGSKMVIITDDAGLSGARNGSSHQSSGQPGALISMPGMEFREPADVRDLYNVLNESFTDYEKPVYVRIHFRTTPLFSRLKKYTNSTSYYPFGEIFTNADVILVGSGLTSQSILDAQKLLINKGVRANIVNVINPNSLDEKFTHLLQEGRPVLTVYNGNESILRHSVAAAVMKDKQTHKPSSITGHGFSTGTTGGLKDLLYHFELDGEGIVNILERNRLI